MKIIAHTVVLQLDFSKGQVENICITKYACFIFLNALAYSKLYWLVFIEYNSMKQLLSLIDIPTMLPKYWKYTNFNPF